MINKQYPYKKTLGLKFPFTLGDSSGLLSLDESYEVIKQNMLLFFKTERGSRIMRPNIGVIIRNKLGDPLNDITRDAISNNISDQLERHFPDIRITEININQPEELKLGIIIKYKLKNRVNQIYPDEIKILIE